MNAHSIGTDSDMSYSFASDVAKFLNPVNADSFEEPVMHTTAEWLQRVETIPEEFESWLVRQYLGEVRATKKIAELASDINQIVEGGDEGMKPIVDLLQRISDDENRHAQYIFALLDLYEIPINEDECTERYWKHAMQGVQSFDDVFAVGAHAEEMRLERIRAVMESEVFDDVVISVFKRIYQDEENHVKWFRSLCSDEAYERMSKSHQNGLNALGLVL